MPKDSAEGTKSTVSVSRRDLIKSSALAGGGMVIGFSLPVETAEAKMTGGAVDGAMIDAWLTIRADNQIVVTVEKTEMGQGAHTAIPMMVAEELGVSWDHVHVEMAPSLAVYAGERGQGTGGSSGVRTSFDQMRMVGAVAREKLKAAAAARWGIAGSDVTAARGVLVNSVSGERLTYGEVAEAASAVELDGEVVLKSPDQWTVIGTDMPRTDTPSKVDGSAIFGVDVQLDGLKVAAVKNCPVFGGTLKSVDHAPALAIPGVDAVVETETAVVVVGSGYWPTTKGVQALSPEWDFGANAAESDDTIGAGLTDALESEKDPALDSGDVDGGFSAADKTIEASYEVPYLAHAPMEPMNATVWVKGDQVEAWIPTQMQTRSQRAIADAVGLPPENVIVYTTQLGGGFGRRLTPDYVTQAALASKAVGAPVKVIWSREEDMQHSTYRPRAKVRFKGGLSSEGQVTAWDVRMAEDSAIAGFLRGPMAARVGEFASLWMTAREYGVENTRFTYHHVPSAFPIGPWRSVQASHNGFFGESMVDEMAHAAGEDPLEFRIARAVNPRHKAVLEKLKEVSQWASAPAGQARGVAIVESFGSIIAQTVDLSVENETDIKLHKICCVVDCGTAVHPAGVVAQAESAIIFGMTAAMFGEINLADGRVQQANFDTYDMMRLGQTPDIETVIIDSGAEMGGMGEPGLPPIAPALANALFAATGKRERTLPLAKAGYWLV